MEMLELILANQRRPNDPFSPQLLMAIFWEEGFFTNKKQLKGSAIGFGQAEPAELPKLTTHQARDNGYEVPGVSAATRELSDALAVTVPSCMLLHLFHSSRAPTTEGKVTSALHGYAGVDYTGPSPLSRDDRLRIIANWRKCEELLKALPFRVYPIVNYPGNLTDLEDKYMDALAKAKPFVRDYEFSKTPRVRFRDLLFPKYWFMPGLGAPSPAAAAATPAASASAREDHFHLVAGPGESVADLRPGDVIVSQPGDGSPPRAARIRSAPASAEELFFEGVMAERGGPGLYVEVESRGRHPIARQVADHRGRVRRGTVVLRPRALSFAEGLDEATDDELRRQRAALVAQIARADLFWHEVPLAGGYRIQVCSPVLKDNAFVPVTAAETMEMARRFEVFPLSRAVMDQAHNAAVKVAKPETPPSLYDFITYSNRLKPTPYMTEFGYALTSGAHKLWVISSRGPVINYGFYIRRVASDPVRCGPRLDAQYNVIQSLGARHNATHWDYSQLLQFMSRLRDPGGQLVDLRQALIDKHPAVWDEAQPPAAGSLP